MKPHLIESYKRNFPSGTRVKLLSMDDAHAVPPGTAGTVTLVDDIGNIHVHWDNGSALAICPDVDQFQKLPEPKKTNPTRTTRHTGNTR